jgi:hypothetical protein
VAEKGRQPPDHARPDDKIREPDHGRRARGAGRRRSRSMRVARGAPGPPGNSPARRAIVRSARGRSATGRATRRSVAAVRESGGAAALMPAGRIRLRQPVNWKHRAPSIGA